MKVLITGAAGNLGSILARHLASTVDWNLRLMCHVRDVASDLREKANVEVVRADLRDRGTLRTAVEGVDQVIHFAGVLFKARPEKFLPETNTKYFWNLVNVASAAGVSRVVLVSFPHVEGPSSFEHPAQGRLDGAPISIHARTRLEEEKCLFSETERGVSLRVGMVYGRGVLMIDAAKWLARRRLLGVWREPTEIHLISKIDFCRACEAVLQSSSASGIYHVGDEGRITLQAFLEEACLQWTCHPPWRMPLRVIYAAARLCETYSLLTGGAAPLTRDFIDIGRVSYHGDTRRFRRELVQELVYPTLDDGIGTL